MDSIQDRLTTLRRQQGLNQKAFAQKLGVSQSYISSLENGERELSGNLLRQLAEVFGVSTDWLLNGTDTPPTSGLVLAQPSTPIVTEDYLSGKQERLQVVTVDADNEPRIVLVPVKAQAGYARGRLDSVFMQDLPVLSLPDAQFRHGTFRAFEVAGDSMEPTFYGRDLVICRNVQDWRWIRAMELYVVVLQDDVLIKRLKPAEGGKPVLELRSDNDYYPAQRVPLTEVVEVWQVMARFTTHLPAPQARA